MRFGRDDGAAASQVIQVYLQVFKRFVEFPGKLEKAFLAKAAEAKILVIKSFKTREAASGENGEEGERLEEKDGSGSRGRRTILIGPLPPVYALPCSSRLVRVVLSGMQRAIPFLSPEAAAELLEEPLDSSAKSAKPQSPSANAKGQLVKTLYKMAHTLPCVSSRILVMRILQSLTTIHRQGREARQSWQS